MDLHSGEQTTNGDRFANNPQTGMRPIASLQAKGRLRRKKSGMPGPDPLYGSIYIHPMDQALIIHTTDSFYFIFSDSQPPIAYTCFESNAPCVLEEAKSKWEFFFSFEYLLKCAVWKIFTLKSSYGCKDVGKDRLKHVYFVYGVEMKWNEVCV